MNESKLHFIFGSISLACNNCIKPATLTSPNCCILLLWGFSRLFTAASFRCSDVNGYVSCVPNALKSEMARWPHYQCVQGMDAIFFNFIFHPMPLSPHIFHFNKATVNKLTRMLYTLLSRGRALLGVVFSSVEKGLKTFGNATKEENQFAGQQSSLLQVD